MNIDDPRYVKALRHPLRVRVLAILEERTASPVQLAEWLGASLGVVSYHVRTLHRLDLIELMGETPRRGAVEHHYRAKPRPEVSVKAWEDAAPMAKQALLGATLQQIHEYALASAAAGGFDRAEAHLTRTHVTVDDEGWRDLAAAVRRLEDDVERIEREAARRLAPPRADDRVRIRAGIANMLFQAHLLSEPGADAEHGSEGEPADERTGPRRSAARARS